MVSCNGHWSLSTVTNNLNFVVKGDNTEFALSSSVSHVVNLRIDSCFDTLDTRYVGHATVGLVNKLVRAISKLTHLSS